MPKENNVLEIPIADLDFMPDRDLGNLDGLKASIAAYGVLSPISVSKNGDGKFKVNYGRRRVLACQALGLEKVPAIVHDFGDVKLDVSVVENTNRLDLSDYELYEKARHFIEVTGSWTRSS